MNAYVPTRRGALERAAGFLEHHLTEVRNRAIEVDKHEANWKETERLVLDATETAFAAGMLRHMAEQTDDASRTRTVT